MVALYTPTPEERAEFEAWLAERPPAVRAVAERLVPWELYRLKTTDQRVTLHSYDEPLLKDGSPDPDGKVTVKVIVGGKYNFVTMERLVFGIDPDDLEPCSLPPKEEPVGVVYTDPDEVEAFVDRVRVDSFGPERAAEIKASLGDKGTRRIP